METQKQSWSLRFNSRNPVRGKKQIIYCAYRHIYTVHNIQIYYIWDFRLSPNLVEGYRRFGGTLPPPSQHKASRQRNPFWIVYCFTQGSRNTVLPVFGRLVCSPIKIIRNILWLLRCWDHFPVGVDFPQPSGAGLGSTQPPVKWVPGLFPGSKAVGTWSCPPTPL